MEEGLSQEQAEQRVTDPNYRRRHLADLVAHPTACAAQLEEVHVVALRYYTSDAFESLNDPVRQPNGPHPFAVTVAFVAEGVKRLRAVNANESQPPRLWRGLKNVRESLPRIGGTERGTLSCTPDMATAVRFSASREALQHVIKRFHGSAQLAHARGVGRCV